MKLRLVASLCVVLSGVSHAKNQAVAFEALAAKVQILSPHELTFSAHGLILAGSKSQSSDNLEKEFATVADRTSFEEFASLLKHSDPKVRTLGLAGLFRSENPQALPLMAGLVTDQAATFLRSGDLPQVSLPGSQILPQEQTVGMVARTLVDFYLKRASIRYQVTSVNGGLGFAEYWDERKDRKACASWFAARLRSAVGNGVPSDPVSIQRIRKEIDALPGDEGPLTLLWLQGVYGKYSGHSERDNLLITPGELVGQLKKIGREKLWRILQEQKVSDDPDLNIREGNSNFGGMQRFLFEHAPEVFAAEDADRMVALGRENPRGPSGWWTAAARLQPKRGAEILHDGLEFLEEFNPDDYTAIPLVACLWDLEGKKEARFVLDWYYARDSAGKAFREEHWERLIREDREGSARKLMRLLLEDARAENLGNKTLSEMASTVNAWARRPVITPDEIRALRGGWGKGGPRAESRDVPGVLDRLRKSIPEWDV